MPDRGGVGRGAGARSCRRSAWKSCSLERLADGPVHGVYWLPALDDEGDLQDMTLAAWREAVDIRVKSLYRTMRVAL